MRNTQIDTTGPLVVPWAVNIFRVVFKQGCLSSGVLQTALQNQYNIKDINHIHHFLKELYQVGALIPLFNILNSCHVPRQIE